MKGVYRTEDCSIVLVKITTPVMCAKDIILIDVLAVRNSG